jgi:SpoVK/Ycf46/Vps4 family AAA+-type ATPase
MPDFFRAELHVSTSPLVSENVPKHYLYVHIDQCKKYGYVPGEWVFVLKAYDPMDVIGIGQIWTRLPEGEDKFDIPLEVVYCQMGFLISFALKEKQDGNVINGLTGTNVVLIPMWVRRVPPLPAGRVFLKGKSIEHGNFYRKNDSFPIDSDTRKDIESTFYSTYGQGYIYPQLILKFSNAWVEIDAIEGLDRFSGENIEYSTSKVQNLQKILDSFPLYYIFEESALLWYDSINGPPSAEKRSIDFKAFIAKFPTLNPMHLLELLHHTCAVLTKSKHAPNYFYSFLLHGPSGTGKSFFCQQLLNFLKDLPSYIYTISWGNIWEEACSDSYKVDPDGLLDSPQDKRSLLLTGMFEKAKKSAPSIIVLDGLDELFSSLSVSKDSKSPNNDSTQNLPTLDMMSLLLSHCLKDLSGHKVCVFIVARQLSDIPHPEWLIGRDPSASICFDLFFDLPSTEARLKFLYSSLCDSAPISKAWMEACIQKNTHRMHSWSYSDLSSFCTFLRHAGLSNEPEDLESKISALSISDKDKNLDTSEMEKVFQRLVDMFRQRIQRSISNTSDPHKSAIEDVSVSWDDIGGQEYVKARLQEAIEWPLYHPAKFSKMGIPSTRGILMYGPPGNSKTLLARALSHKSSCNFLTIKGPQLFNKWVGESEKAVRALFRQARSLAPCVLFLDEVDAIGAKRGTDSSGVSERLLTQLLIEMDGLDQHASSINDPLPTVIVIAATNRPDILDPALLRPGRLDRLIYIPLPDPDTRSKILCIQRDRVMRGSWEDVSIKQIVDLTRGYSGAELVELCQVAGTFAMKQDPKNAQRIKQEHFDMAFKKCSTIFPRTSSAMISYYETFSKQHRVSIDG